MKRILATAAAGAAALTAAAAVNVISMPNKVVENEGSFKIDGDVAACVAYTKDPAIAPEGYRLSVTSGGIAVASSDEAGRFYALQTLRQLGNPVPCGVDGTPIITSATDPRLKAWERTYEGRD